MKSNTQNAKIEAITENTLVLGIDIGIETHYARPVKRKSKTFYFVYFLTAISVPGTSKCL
jgi:hypothetical protein